MVATDVFPGYCATCTQHAQELSAPGGRLFVSLLPLSHPPALLAPFAYGAVGWPRWESKACSTLVKVPYLAFHRQLKKKNHNKPKSEVMQDWGSCVHHECSRPVDSWARYPLATCRVCSLPLRCASRLCFRCALPCVLCRHFQQQR